jgi:hypothetical protein
LPRLRNNSWWPTVWVSPTGWFVTNEEIIRIGRFQNARHTTDGLRLEVEHQGIICTATIKSSPDLSENNLILLRDTLLQYCREEMRSVADLEIDFTKSKH